MIIEPKEIKLKSGKVLVLKSPQPEHAQNLINHFKNLFNHSYRNMNMNKNFWDTFAVEEEVKILTDFSTSPSKFMISAFDGDKIIGNLGCFGMAGEFHKYNSRIGMGLEKEFHNLGLGTALLKYAVEISKKNKIHRLELNVRTFNEPGISLYEKSGFNRVGILKEVAFIDGNFCDEYVYEMIIGNSNE
ncbi:MAG: GNAT family N-acetyltransferase [Bdellovibrionaceae bacterium]|nr:GNAT family N-acetyltransferase [Pseudobdellovibrionaceae bacterium]